MDANGCPAIALKNEIHSNKIQLIYGVPHHLLSKILFLKVEIIYIFFKYLYHSNIYLYNF